MSFNTWHQYGYGFTNETISQEKINFSALKRALKEYCPEFVKSVVHYFDDTPFDRLTYDNIEDNLCNDCADYEFGGICSFICELLNAKAEEKFPHIQYNLFGGYTDFDDVCYFLFVEGYPWDLKNQGIMDITMEQLNDIVKETFALFYRKKYEIPKCGFQECANGG